ncbi:hypothetical protein BBH51_09360 [Aggregatibacter actinomycetemcomitans]|uniref:Uncharacterized protein n=1 Tax=Aggregatibacter actinomycetemcomitans TaxID=714 RepID=A0AAC9F9L5_AGGAC|nr:hypothetical protein ACT75_09090 [Aggregatibacter actinomycetemcomitans]ANN81619.1 hypothetical protein D7S_02840 [Aggregatibacter actinomycetemcomitans D7S-1]EKX98357.1 hypothetical protein HMPREF9996_00369 [Aggregatibacter actinomycetemcomitans Y4]KND82252.1 hypothetical protein H5P1_0210995 [Aggregatibacter actinomycetemcomitans serotype a str. H5P1]KOE30924.1 hypothetical protein D17P3_0307000 [Aggregatibacter actinomycetemcomitans D17P-3]KOE62720.1 hypothetical protein A160_0210320 [Ag
MFFIFTVIDAHFPLARLRDKCLHLSVGSANDPEGASEASIGWRKSEGFSEGEGEIKFVSPSL